ncbi:MAG TPA: ATP-binding cassette domain-containing protein [Anaerolineales bacterium]|nr:ATP-binding cassette domain-containing protein [Anaerolineales bacterium]
MSEQMQTPAIELRQVVKRFKNAAGEFVALRGVNLEICPGDFVAIVGKSGSGKSTLLNMITGIDHPTSGKVLVDGVDIYQKNESERALWRGRNLGIVFQFFQLLPMLNLLENVILPMDYCNVYLPSERPERAMELLRRVGLEDQATKLPASVSSGQQQAAAIARALATDPPIVVADEPTGNLDSRSSDEIISLFDQLVAQGKTIIIVTHDPSITRRTARTLIISDGEIIDETVARALPLLNHDQMRKVSKLLQSREYAPGEMILRKGGQVDNFYMIANGQVEIVLQKHKEDYAIAQLGPGQFFGEVELIHGGDSIASVRSSDDSPVRLVTLPHKEFTEMLKGSPLTEEALCKIVQDRLAENRAAAPRRWFQR